MKRILLWGFIFLMSSVCSAHKEIEVKIKFSSRQLKKFTEWLELNAQHTKTLSQRDCYLDFVPSQNSSEITVFLEQSIGFGAQDPKGTVHLLDQSGHQTTISVDDIADFANLLEGIGAVRNKAVDKNSKKMVFTVKSQQLKSFMFTRADGLVDCLKTLRVRFDERGALICYKHRHIDASGHTTSRDEFETRVKKSDTEAVVTFFKKLGFEERFVVAKQRNKYKHKEFEIMVDDVDKLGRFVEIECWSAGDDVALGMQRIYDLLKSIKYKKLTMCDRGYLQILMNKNHKKLFEEKVTL